MTDCADNLMLAGVVRPCPDCADDRIFVAPDPCEEAVVGIDFACTDCGAALLIDPCLFADEEAILDKAATGTAALLDVG